MSRILHLINMGLRYGRSKGVQVYRLEEHPLASLAAPCHLEESASHHILKGATHGSKNLLQRAILYRHKRSADLQSVCLNTL